MYKLLLCKNKQEYLWVSCKYLNTLVEKEKKILDIADQSWLMQKITRTTKQLEHDMWTQKLWEEECETHTKKKKPNKKLNINLTTCFSE